MPAWNRETFRIGPRTVEVVEASLVELSAHSDAIVSSDDNLLSHGGGVSRTIWRKAGRDLPRFVNAAQPVLRLGDVFLTPAGELDARVLLHAITVDFDANKSIGTAEIGPLYRKVLLTAEDQECRSVALPLLATGAAGLGRRESIHGLLVAIDAWLATPSPLTTVTLAVIGASFQESVTLLKAALVEQHPIEWLVERATGGVTVVDSDQLRSNWDRLLRSPRESWPPILALMLGDSSRIAAASWGARLPAQASIAEVLRACADGARATGNPFGVEVQARLAEAALNGAAAQSQLTSEAIDATARWVRDVLAVVRTDYIPPTFEADRDLEEVVECFDLSAEDLGHIEDHFRSVDARSASEHALFECVAALPCEDAVARSPRSPKRRAETRMEDWSGTRAIRQLHQFLLENLAPEEMALLQEDLQAQNYHGEPSLRLLEHCVAVDVLDSLITDHISKARLVTAIEKRTGRRPSLHADSRDIARRFLEDLGFPVPSQPRGLRTVITTIEAVQPGVAVGTEQEVRGAIAQTSRQLEYLCHVMLRFVATAVYGRSVEQLLRGWGVLKESTRLSTVGLGTMFGFLEELDTRLQTDASPAVELFRREMKTYRLVPVDAHTGSLSETRNRFVHYKEGEEGGVTDTELRRRAASFLDQAKGFLQYWQDPEHRVFPHIVLVDEIILDRWGRRKVWVVDDERRRELVFTDTPLKPGRVYFMHPLTNPLRVDPLLVPAGDLLWPEVSA